MPSLNPVPATSPSSPKTIPLTSYIFTRLHQLGVHAVHGVPGDYNLTALDHVAPSNLTWVGNCNELNAGYAADGYSRIKGLGALITAFGVGELSAINAIGGAYAEQAAVVHIVGTPPRAAQKTGMCLHHSFGDGDFRVFARMAEGVTVAQANLVEEDSAAGEVDRVLRECVVRSRPVYIELPTDMVNVPVDAGRLATPVDTSPAAGNREMEMKMERAEDRAIHRVMDWISEAKQPFLMVDGFTARWSIFAEIDALVRLLGWPTTSTPFGKSCVDETLPNFHGIYAGIAGRSIYKPWVDSCDLVLRFGGLDSDVNTYGFSTLPPDKATIHFQRDSVIFGDTTEIVKGVHIKSLLRKLLKHLKALEAQSGEGIPKMSPYPTHLGDPRDELASLPPVHPSAPIEQHDFWRRISQFFQEGDVILTETGTPSVGSREFVLPRNARLVNSSIWLSIGYMLGAAQGAAMAVRGVKGLEVGENGDAETSKQRQENPRQPHRRLNHPVLSSTTASGRTILFEGDGSFQMSAQELSTIIKHELDLTLFLINNDGYVIERFIHGMKATYNDVAPWRYLDAPYFFGAQMEGGVEGAESVNGVVGTGRDGHNVSHPSGASLPQQPEKSGEGCEYKIQTYQARTWGELLSITSKPEVRSGKGLCMIEVFMGREDAPESLKRLVANVKRRNSGESEREAVSGGREEEGKVVEEKVMKAAG